MESPTYIIFIIFKSRELPLGYSNCNPRHLTILCGWWAGILHSVIEPPNMTYARVKEYPSPKPLTLQGLIDN